MKIRILVLPMKIKSTFFFALLALVFLPLKLHGQEDRIAAQKKRTKEFWEVYNLALKYKSTNLQKADSIRKVMIDLSYQEGEYAQFTMWLN